MDHIGSGLVVGLVSLSLSEPTLQGDNRRMRKQKIQQNPNPLWEVCMFADIESPDNVKECISHPPSHDGIACIVHPMTVFNAFRFALFKLLDDINMST